MRYSVEGYVCWMTKVRVYGITTLFYGERAPFILQHESLLIYGWWRLSQIWMYFRKYFVSVAHWNILILNNNRRRWQIMYMGILARRSVARLYSLLSLDDRRSTSIFCHASLMVNFPSSYDFIFFLKMMPSFLNKNKGLISWKKING